MSQFREKEFSITISYTTDGETVNRITGSRQDGTMLSKEILIEYLRQFCNVNLVPLNMNYNALQRDIIEVVENHLKNARRE